MTKPPAQSPFLENSGIARRVVLSKSPHAALTLENDRVELIRDADTPGAGQIIDERTHVQLRFGKFRTSLQLAELSVSLSASRLREALRMIALGRVTSGTLPIVQPAHWLHHLSDAVFFDGLDEISRVLLHELLEENEWPLAWLPTNHELTGHSRELGQWRAPAHYLLTERRHLLVAQSVLGDIEMQALPRAPLKLRQRRFEVGDVHWKSSCRQQFDAIRSFAALPAGERILAIAKEQWLRQLELAPAVSSLSPSRVPPSTWLQQLLARASELGEPSAAILRRLHTPGLSPSKQEWTRAELAEDLANLSQSWRLGPERSARLLKSIPREDDAMAAATDLARHLWKQDRERASGIADAAHVDLRYAELLLEFGRHAQANELLSARRALWPPLQLQDLELPLRLRPTKERGARRQLEQLAVRAAGPDSRAQTQALLRLQQLDPLNEECLLELSQLADPPLGSRAATARRLLHGPSKNSGEPEKDAALARFQEVTPSPLSEEDWSLLCHPLVANQQRMLSRIQTLVAKTESPDFATLKLYCERITQEDSAVTRAVDRAATLLGLGHTDVYVSRGHDDVGVRAFAHKSPILLIGSQHLDPKSRFFMREPQLLFAVSSELAHVRLGHVRVAPKHVLRGALDKSKQGLDLALSVLPILKGFALANRLGMATAKLSLPQVGKAMNAARALSGAVKNDQGDANSRSDIAMANETLLLAHRLMQLSADRVGLLCCQDPEAAMMAVFLGRSDYVRATTEAAALGALPTIDKQRQGNRDAYDDLVLRLGALLSFYVSDAFALLSLSTYGTGHSEK